MSGRSLDRPLEPVSRRAAWRARAEAAGDRYQRAAQTRPLLGLPLVFLARYTARQGVLLASAAAFRLFLWLLPLALLSAGVLAAVTDPGGGDARSAAKAAGITGAASQEIVTAIESGHRSWPEAVLIGSVLFLWASWTLIRNVTTMNAYVWQVPVPKRRLTDGLVTAVAFAGACVVILAGASAMSRLGSVTPGVLLLGIAVQSLAVAAAWLMVSLRLPDRRESWTDLIPGCLLMGVGLAVLHAISRIYIPPRLAHASELYGSLGVAGVILAWLLIIGQVMVSAALINSVWSEYRHQRRRGGAASGVDGGRGSAGGGRGGT